MFTDTEPKEDEDQPEDVKGQGADGSKTADGDEEAEDGGGKSSSENHKSEEQEEGNGCNKGQVTQLKFNQPI